MSEWTTEPLPEETVAVVRDRLGSLVDGIIAAVQTGSPVYGQVFDGPEGMALRLGVAQAIRAFLDAVERGAPPARETDELWRQLGEAEFQSGRSLEDLRAAFRLGIRAAWRGAADVAVQAGVSAPVAISLAEAIFVYGDELAGDVVEGYLRMASDQAGERDRRRRRLALALLDPDGYDAEAVTRAAELAGWALPRRLAVLALGGDDPGAVGRRLDLDVLAGADAEGAWLVVPDPDGPGRTDVMDRAVGDEPAALGPSVAPRDAARSLAWARLALSLAADGRIGAGPRPVRAVDHLATLILLQDRELARVLAERCLAPLDDLPAGERDRLLRTLGAWLTHQRHTPQVAAQLHVHPQTVRYRIARLRELIGDQLDDPERRFELELALRIYS